MNPAKVTPLATSTCATGTCSVRHEVIGKCVAVSPACPTIADAAVSLTSYQVKTFTRADCGIGKHAVITKYLRVVETNGVSVKVSVAYQKDDTHQSEVKALSDLSCYESAVDELRCKANFNPFMLTPYVTIVCLARGNPCVLNYKVLVECVVASTKCASLASSTITTAAAQPIATGSILQIALAKSVSTDATKTPLACNGATQRADIQSIKILEVNGNKVSVTVKYFRSATMSNTVKSMTDVSCYESSSPSEVNFSTKADAFWEYMNTCS